jgi:predicted phage-related endonuclease
MLAGATRHPRNLEIVADQGDREAWLLARRDGLGGSDVSAIVGENPYKSPINVWDERCDPLAIDGGGGGDRARVGALLEPSVASWWALGDPAWPRGGARRYVWRPPMVAHRDRPWQRGSADGLVVDDHAVIAAIAPGVDIFAECPGLYDPNCNRHGADFPADGGLEIKTHGWAAYAAAYSNPDDPIPPDKKIQIAWYCEMWGLRRWDLVALIDTHHQKGWTYWHDPAFGADLLTIAEDWWKRHIIGRVQPDPDGTEKYGEYLRKRFPDSISQTVHASDALNAEVVKLRAARAARKAAEAEEERLAQIIQSSMGSADTLLTSQGKITWRSQRGRVRTSTANPALYRLLGWSRDQIAAFEDEHRGEDFRTFNVDRSWIKD